MSGAGGASAVRRPAPRAVLDTSVLLSIHRHWLWLFAGDGFCEGLWSPFIVGEVVRVRWQRSAAKGLDPAMNRQLWSGNDRRYNRLRRAALGRIPRHDCPWP